MQQTAKIVRASLDETKVVTIPDLQTYFDQLAQPPGEKDPPRHQLTHAEHAHLSDDHVAFVHALMAVGVTVPEHLQTGTITGNRIRCLMHAKLDGQPARPLFALKHAELPDHVGFTVHPAVGGVALRYDRTFSRTEPAVYTETSEGLLAFLRKHNTFSTTFEVA